MAITRRSGCIIDESAVMGLLVGDDGDDKSTMTTSSFKDEFDGLGLSGEECSRIQMNLSLSSVRLLNPILLGLIPSDCRATNSSNLIANVHCGLGDCGLVEVGDVQDNSDVMLGERLPVIEDELLLDDIELIIKNKQFKCLTFFVVVA